jgi:hypothetical protein
MRHDPPRTGVCLVRIENQRSGMLITLRINNDVTQLSTERVVIVADIEAAVEAVRTFLVAFGAICGKGED